ncbi:MAG TPA: hypothetical protein VFS18_03110 [Actinomycetota bacterium]|nr:hypothetical protein [Actinomycetota bacterium]
MTMVRPFVLAVVVSFLLVPVAAVAGGEAHLTTDKQRYSWREDVRVLLTNDGDETVTFRNPWKVVDRKNRMVAKFYWEDQTLDPGETREWTWDQFTTICGSDGTCSDVSREHVEAGWYSASVRTGGQRLETSFRIGRYFTVGFDGHPDDEFTVYAARHRLVRKMVREARSDDKNLIVSGTVGAAKGYNPDWSFTMRPGSLRVAEVFIEVCDASPDHVEANVDEWRGERWCPWSSYVEKVGRP